MFVVSKYNLFHVIDHKQPFFTEYADDITPYATFHVAGNARDPSPPANLQSFIYHDHRLAAMETLQLKNVSLISPSQ